MANLKMNFPGGKQKALTLSYDDGVEQDKKLISIMVKYGLKGTFNLNSGCYPPEDISYKPGTIHRRMPESEVTKLYTANGMEVAVHGLTHPSLPELPDNRAMYEIIEDRRRLENQFGVLVRGAAYPFGSFNDKVVEILRDAGICYCRTVISSHNFYLPNDWLRLPATCHHDDPELMNLAKRFVELDDMWGNPYMFYLWGHAYEFEEHDNWEVIENFAKTISGKDDIWYATNIEIYDYIQAFKALRFNVEMTECYNPTDITVWFNYDGRKASVEPGKKIKF